MSHLLCSHDLYRLHADRWAAIKQIKDNLEFLKQYEELVLKAPEVRHCSWFDDTHEINLRLLRHLSSQT